MTARWKSMFAPILPLALLVGCGDKGDSKSCEELAAEVEAQEVIQAEIRAALEVAVKDALARAPVAGADDCEATGLDWQKYTQLTPEVLERGHLGDPFYLGEFRPGPSCAKMNPANTQGLLTNLRSRVSSTAKGYRIFFQDLERVESKLLGDNEYSPGMVRGRLLVWSDGERKFVCTAVGEAESGSKIYTTKGGMKNNDSLQDQLTRNAVGDGIEKLKRIQE